MPNTPVSTDFTLYSNGLTWISNLSYVNPRNNIGNITLQESSSSNPILIIEPVKFNYTNQSVVSVIDTRFRFFQFPVSTVTTNDNFTLDTNISISDDTNSKKFSIPATVDDQGQLSTYKRIGTSYESDWFYNGTEKQKGYTRIPFQTDNGEGSYEITPEILKFAKSRNQVIKFTIFVQATSAWKDEYDIDPKGWNTSFQMNIGRTETYDNWESWNGSDAQPVIYTEDSGRLGNDPSTGNPWTVPGRKDSNGNPVPMAGMFGENDYPGMYIEYIIDPINEKPGRKYFVQISAGSPSWILSDTCRWDINIVDKPNVTPIYNNVYNIGPKSRLETGKRSIIATRFDNSDKIVYANGTVYNKLVINKIDTSKTSIKQTAGEFQQEVEYQQTIETNTANAQLLSQIAKDTITGVDSGAIETLGKIDPQDAADAALKQEVTKIKVKAATS